MADADLGDGHYRLRRAIDDIARLERKLDRLDVTVEDIPVLKSELVHMSKALEETARGLSSLRMAVIGAAITFAISAIGFALTVLLSTR